jgi:hypothetical protein
VSSFTCLLAYVIFCGHGLVPCRRPVTHAPTPNGVSFLPIEIRILCVHVTDRMYSHSSGTTTVANTSRHDSILWADVQAAAKQFKMWHAHSFRCHRLPPKDNRHDGNTCTIHVLMRERGVYITCGDHSVCRNLRNGCRLQYFSTHASTEAITEVQKTYSQNAPSLDTPRLAHSSICTVCVAMYSRCGAVQVRQAHN